MSAELMTTKEVAAYLSLNEKKIYALIKKGEIPCTRVTGKWLFPKKVIDKWIEDDIGKAQRQENIENITIMGSHDLAIDVLASQVTDQFPRLVVLTSHIGSLGGLSTLQRGRSHIAGVHLLHPETNEYNLPYLREYAADLKPVVVHFLDREQGFLVQPGNPLGIGGFEDLCRPDVQFINRQEGSGTRLLLDHHLKRIGIRGDEIKGYNDHVSTHTEVAMAVKNKQADTGLGLHAAALAFGLEYIPVTKERFDFVIPRTYFYTEPIQELLEVIRSERFRQEVDRMGGYDVSDTGKVLTWG